VRAEFAAADALERNDPEMVAATAQALATGAEGDVHGRLTRSRAYVRRLQALAVERPELAVAVARVLNLEHIVQELLDGNTVEGVAGIGPEGAVLERTSRHRLRTRGAWMVAISAVVLLVEAVIADGIPSVLLYVWTAVGLVLFMVGGYFILLKE